MNNFIKDCIGAGFLGLPHAFYLSGVVSATFFLIFLAFITYYATLLYIRIANDMKKKKLTGDKILEIALGYEYSSIYNLFVVS